MTKKIKIVVILGPTASGKSDLAVNLAKKFNGEIISADSRQVYKGLDIGTGKITKREMRGVKHHLLDVADPKKQFSVSDFVGLAHKVIEEIMREKPARTVRGGLSIICGGTGFYIDALLGDKQIPEVPPNPELRKKLEKKNADKLFKILQKLDPTRAKNIDAKNPRRLIRAIEICKALGHVPKQIRNPKHQIRNKFKILKIGLKIPNKKLKERINERLEKRLKQGMIAEAKRLYKNGLSYKRMRQLGLEYRRLADYLTGKISKSELTSLLQTEIYQYAKRQLTWFNRDKSIVWLTPKIKFIEREVKKFI